jgi:hypothetical protein
LLKKQEINKMGLRIKAGTKVISGNHFSKTEQTYAMTFNIAELTLLYNIVLGIEHNSQNDSETIEDIIDYITDHFYNDEFDIEDRLWIEYKNETKPVGRSQEYNNRNDRNNKRKFIFSLYETYILLAGVKAELNSSRKQDKDFFEIASQLEVILSAHLFLYKMDSDIVRKFNQYPDYKFCFILNGTTNEIISIQAFAKTLENRQVRETMIQNKTVTFIL